MEIFNVQEKSKIVPFKIIKLDDINQGNSNELLDFINSNFSYIELNVNILFSYTKITHKIKIFVKYFEENTISLNEILNQINTKFTLSNYQIFIKDEEKNIFIYIGIYPLKENSLLNFINRNENEITIKLREVIYNIESPNLIKKNIMKRSKERLISEIIHKVYMWRKLYEGINNNNGNKIKFSLETAALQLNISKKSLDDYLYQIKNGRMLGFNFSLHKNDKIGILRQFIKKNKYKISKNNNNNNSLD